MTTTNPIELVVKQGRPLAGEAREAGQSEVVPARTVLSGRPANGIETLYLELANTCNSLCTTCPLTFGIHETPGQLTFEEIRNFGFQRGVIVWSRFQLGLPA